MAWSRPSGGSCSQPWEIERERVRVFAGPRLVRSASESCLPSPNPRWNIGKKFIRVYGHKGRYSRSLRRGCGCRSASSKTRRSPRNCASRSLAQTCVGTPQRWLSGSQLEMSASQFEVGGSQIDMSASQFEIGASQFDLSASQFEWSGTQFEWSGTQHRLRGTLCGIYHPYGN